MIATAYAGNAIAQEVIETVVVTAQKRKEKLQDVPLAMTAIGGAQLETRGIEGIKDLTGLAPNVTVKAAAPGAGLIAAISIRGMNQGQPAIWADGSVGMYVDGVFVGKNQGALFEVVDLERVEVLRGPQGTLFGRNTEGGAINMITTKPTGEWGGSATIDVGNYNRHSERIAMDLPAFGIMRTSLALRNEKRDGTIDNPNGAAWDSRDRQAARFAAGFDISKNFKIDYAYDRSKIDETPGAISLIDSTGYAKLYTAPGIAGNYNFFQNAAGPKSLGRLLAQYVNTGYPDAVATDPTSARFGNAYFNKLDTDGHSLIASYEISPSNAVKYIGARRKMHYQDRTDLDGTPIQVYNAGKNTHYVSTSHELQWIGNTEKMNYVAGAYLFRDDGNTLSYQDGLFYTFNFAPAQYKLPYYRIRTDAAAVFGQVDYKLTPRLNGTLGLRYTREEKKGDIWRANTNANFDLPGSPGVSYQPGYTPQSAEATFSSTTPVLALAYKLTDNVNLFGRYAKGFKGGGFPLEANTNGATGTGPLVPFSPEISTSYEAGVKSTLLGGKAQLNATVFLTNVKDWQTSQLPPNGTSPTITNAGKVRTQGLELEGKLQVADGWRVQASYGFLDAKFKEYMAYNQLGALVNIAENTRNSYAPRHSLNLNLDGRLAETRFGTLRGIVDYTYTSNYVNYAAQKSAIGTNVAIGNSVEESTIPALGLVNARLLLANIPMFGDAGTVNASLWVRNLTDVRKPVAHIDVGGYYRIAGWQEPRTFGLSLNYKW
ncbi:TonB-dependent receptor [Massilia cavernae]|nr:TonB-dependent receptor [Massilia cavernae]